MKARLQTDVQTLRAAHLAIQSAVGDFEEMVNALPVAERRAATT